MLMCFQDYEVMFFLSLTLLLQVVTRNLNKIIDINFYPVPEVHTYIHTLQYCSSNPLPLHRLSDPTNAIDQ